MPSEEVDPVDETQMKSPQLLEDASNASAPEQDGKISATLADLDDQVEERTGQPAELEEACSFSSEDKDEGDSTPEKELEDQQHKVEPTGGSPTAAAAAADAPCDPAPVLPSKTKVAGLKQWFEAKAAEFKSSSGALAKKAPHDAGKREPRAPELMSLREKKHLFEEKIKQSKRWSAEMAEAKDATRRLTKKFG